MGWKKNELGGKKQDSLRDQAGNLNLPGEQKIQDRPSVDLPLHVTRFIWI